MPGDSEENHEKSVLIARVLVDIRTEHLLNTSLDRYNYTSLLSDEIIDSSILVLSFCYTVSVSEVQS